MHFSLFSLFFESENVNTNLVLIKCSEYILKYFFQYSIYIVFLFLLLIVILVIAT